MIVVFFISNSGLFNQDLVQPNDIFDTKTPTEFGYLSNGSISEICSTMPFLPLPNQIIHMRCFGSKRSLSPLTQRTPSLIPQGLQKPRMSSLSRISFAQIYGDNPPTHLAVAITRDRGKTISLKQADLVAKDSTQPLSETNIELANVTEATQEDLIEVARDPRGMSLILNDAGQTRGKNKTRVTSVVYFGIGSQESSQQTIVNNKVEKVAELFISA